MILFTAGLAFGLAGQAGAHRWPGRIFPIYELTEEDVTRQANPERVERAAAKSLDVIYCEKAVPAYDLVFSGIREPWLLKIAQNHMLCVNPTHSEVLMAINLALDDDLLIQAMAIGRLPTKLETVCRRLNCQSRDYST